MSMRMGIGHEHEDLMGTNIDNIRPNAEKWISVRKRQDDPKQRRSLCSYYLNAVKAVIPSSNQVK